ncbi:MAG: type II toxin-antitoxin system VapC family toxin [Actinomycetota bacterium]|nr:type II toxin-antitoxin system VapC family toxin [Actinomycetota bacterium]
MTPTDVSQATLEPDVLVDTSVAVPLVVADHEHHHGVVEAVGNRTLGLSGHAAFETFSILTRLPPPARRSPGAVARLIAHNFPATRFLSDHSATELLARLGTLGIAGGAVYDALVGAAAVQHELTLMTRDRRAVDTYRRLDVKFVLVD